MDRITERFGEWIQIKGCKAIYGNEYRPKAPAYNAIVRLAAYEDTGLTPEEIKVLIPQPNDPLTLDELREMVGEPVWVHYLGGYGTYDCWQIVNGRGAVEGLKESADISDYGKDWIAYRCKPEE